MLFRLRVPFLVLFIFTALSVYGQKLDLTNLTFANIREGIPQMPISSICQDKHGFTWIGTRGAGLYRFDGKNYYPYTYNALNDESLNSNLIFSSFIDSEDNLWIGTNVGLNRYNRDLDIFEQIHLKSNHEGDPVIIDVKSLIEDDNKNLIIGTYSSGVLKLNINTLITSVVHIELDNTVRSFFINNLSRSKTGTIYAATNQGLKYLDQVNNALVDFTLDNSPLTDVLSTHVETLIFDKEDNLWAGTADKGIYKISNIENAPKLSVFPISSKKILSLCAYENHILSGTENDGLIVVDTNGNPVKTYINNLFDPESLSSNSVWSLFIDKQHRLWVGYYNRGVSIHNSLRSKFSSIQNHPNKNSLQGHSVSAIRQDKRGWYWIGVTGGVDIFKPKSNTFEHINGAVNSKYKGLTSKDTQTVFIDSNSNIWVGTWDKGIYLLEAGKKTFVNYTKENTPHAINSSGITCFAEDSKGRIWIGSFLKGLLYFDANTKTFHKCDSTPFVDYNLTNSDVKVVMIDDSDVIWMGTTSGLFQIEPMENGNFSVTSLRAELASVTKDHPSIHDILSLFQSKDGMIWIGTNGGGLFSYDKNSKKVTNYNNVEGFTETSVNTIIEDNEGTLWLSGISGITALNVKTKKAINYTVDDGLMDNYFNNGAVLKNNKGELYFGGYSGINHFNPKNIENNTITPKLYLSSLKLFNKDVDITSKHSPLSKVISQTKKIALKHNQSVFTINYGSISYTQPDKNQYAYKLDGFDKDWNYVGNSTSATYTNLPKGDYIFKLKGANNDGVWNTTPLILDITIRPAWWESTYAYIGAILFFIIALFLISKFIKARFKQKQLIAFEREKRMQEEHLNKKKLQFFTNISHEFRTPLTLIINPLEDIIKDTSLTLTDDIKHKHKIIRKNADRLSRLINELMDFRKLQLNKIAVQAQEIDIIAKVENVLAYFEEEAKQRQIELTFETSISSLKTWIDSGMLEKILFNILSNAFKITPDKGKITTRVKVREVKDAKNIESSNAIDISIADTGPGLNQKEYKNIFKRFYQVGKDNKDYYGSTGIGLEMVKSFVQLNKGKIDVKSIIGQGTTFTVSFPIGKSQYTMEEIISDSRPESVKKAIAIKDDKTQISPPISLTENTNLKKEHTLLIVEDNIELRTYLKNELEKTYTVYTAENGKIGYNIAEKETPNVILTDVVMPIMDGYELCKNIKTNVKTSHIPLLMLTAKVMTEEKIQGIESGADAYLSKPFDMGVLKSTLKQLLTSRQLLFDKYNTNFIVNKNQTKTTPLDKTFIEKVLDFIDTNISDTNLGVEILSSEFNLSRSQFYRKIKALTGISANELIRKIRLEKAKQLLETGNYNVNEVTYKIGFSSPSYFTKCFKAEYNHLPTESIK